MTTLTHALHALHARRRRRSAARLLILGVLVALTIAVFAGPIGLLDAAGPGAAAADIDDDDARPPVLLVNAEHAIPQDWVRPELVGLAGTLPVSGSDVQVAADLLDPLRDLFAAAAEAGHPGLYINSGYRSAQEQQALWDAAQDRSFVQPPGHSEHETGLAVDLADLEPDGATFGESSSGRWLAEHAWRYGFIVRYPEGKEDITGISHEAWHFRWVGPAVAEILQREGLTLEEYAASR